MRWLPWLRVTVFAAAGLVARDGWAVAEQDAEGGSVAVPSSEVSPAGESSESAPVTPLERAAEQKPEAAETHPQVALLVAPPPPSSAPPRDSYDGPPLLLRSKVAIGGYGGSSASYTQMLGRTGTLIGLEGAVLLDHRFSVGFLGYGFTETPRGPSDAEGMARRFGTGYGGVVLRYSWLTRSPVYFSVGGLVGGGAVTLQPDPLHETGERRDFEFGWL